MGKTVTRLYSQFKPENYHIELTPDDQNLTFSAYVTVRGKKIGRPSKRLTFHQKDLKFKKVNLYRKLKNGEGELIPITRTNVHKSYDEIRIHTDQMLYPGEYLVHFEYSGVITRPMNGLYPCFFEHEGKQKKLLATQFESHHAREVFPCIDEPEAKATFDLALVIPNDDARITIANTPAHEPIVEGDKKTIIFDT